MEITLEQIQEAAKENAELRQGLVAYTSETEEGKELLNNHAKAHFDSNIGTKIGETHSMYDEIAFEVLGERKDPTEKSKEYYRKKFERLKELEASQGGDHAQEIKRLKEELKQVKENPGNNDYWHKVHTQATSDWESERNSFTEKINKLKGELSGNTVGSDLSTGLAGLEFNPNIPKAAIEATVADIKRKAIANSRIDDGKVVYLKDDGNPRLNAKYEPITAAELLKEDLDEFLKKQGSPGGGADKDKKGGIHTVDKGGKSTEILSLDKTKVTTKLAFEQEASRVLVAQGVEKNSKRWNELKDAAYKEYGVSELPRQ